MEQLQVTLKLKTTTDPKLRCMRRGPNEIAAEEAEASGLWGLYGPAVSNLGNRYLTYQRG